MAGALAAILPIDADHAEQFVSSEFDADGNGILDSQEIQKWVLLFVRKRLSNILDTVSQPPEIHQSSSHADFLEWFDHWDREKAGHIATSCLQMALVASMNGSGTIATKRALARVVLSEAGLSEGDSVSRMNFLHCIVPMLKLNLPENDDTEDEWLGGRQDLALDHKRPIAVCLVSSDGKRKQAVVPPCATVGVLRSEVRRQYRVWLGSKDARLCLAGKMLLDDNVPVAALPRLGESVVQVFKVTKVVLPAVRSTGSESDSSSSEFDCSSDDSADYMSGQSSSSGINDW